MTKRPENLIELSAQDYRQLLAQSRGCPDCGSRNVTVQPAGELRIGDTARCNSCASVFNPA